jgi:hypothetical protein
VTEVTKERSGWRLEAILAALGVPRSVYFEWRLRAKNGCLDDAAPVAPRLDALLAAETQAIRDFALRHPKVGWS